MSPEPEHRDARIDALLRTLDHPPPRVTADDVIRRSERGGFGWRRAAAAILAAVAVAGAAYALPGSPVASWIEGLGGGDGRDAAPGDAGQAAEPDGSGAGLPVDAEGEVVVEFRSAGLAGHVRVTLTEGTDVLVRSAPGAGRYTLEPDRLVIERLTSDTFHVSVPGDAGRVEILTGGRSVFVSARGVVSAAASPDETGAYGLDLGPDAP